MFKLHNYFRSSTSTRVRVALNLKDLPYAYIGYALLKDESKTAEYLSKNPAGLVPTLEREDGTFLIQSLAIIEWLDETHPEPPLLPADADGRARVRGISYMIACEIHPLNNLRVLQYLGKTFDATDEIRKEWFRHWVRSTFDPLEKMLSRDSRTGTFCHGDQPSLADVCLYAQIWNNKRFEIDTRTWPTINRIFDALDAIPAFSEAAPPKQPDAF